MEGQFSAHRCTILQYPRDKLDVSTVNSPVYSRASTSICDHPLGTFLAEPFRHLHVATETRQHQTEIHTFG